MSSPKAKSLKFQEVRTHMGIFDFDILCIVGNYANVDEYIAWKFEQKDFDGVEFDRGYEPYGRCYFRPGYVPVIWIPHKPKTSREIGTLAHECLHAVMHLFDWAAIPTTRDTEEVMCHSLSHVVNNILKELK